MLRTNTYTCFRSTSPVELILKRGVHANEKTFQNPIFSFHFTKALLLLRFWKFFSNFYFSKKFLIQRKKETEKQEQENKETRRRKVEKQEEEPTNKKIQSA